MKYKSPDDSLNIDTLYKSQAYAALYKTSSNTVNKIKAIIRKNYNLSEETAEKYIINHI